MSKKTAKARRMNRQKRKNHRPATFVYPLASHTGCCRIFSQILSGIIDRNLTDMEKKVMNPHSLFSPWFLQIMAVGTAEKFLVFLYEFLFPLVEMQDFSEDPSATRLGVFLECYDLFTGTLKCDIEKRRSLIFREAFVRGWGYIPDATFEECIFEEWLKILSTHAKTELFEILKARGYADEELENEAVNLITSIRTRCDSHVPV